MLTIIKQEYHSDILSDGVKVAEVGPTFLRTPSTLVIYPHCPDNVKGDVLSMVAARVLRYGDANGTNEEITAALASEGFTVLTLAHTTVKEAVNAALAQVEVPVRARLTTSHLYDETRVRFQVRQPHRFEFWKAVSVSSSDEGQLHLVPAYHPHQQGVDYDDLINGCTDALVRGSGVRSVRCPRASNAGHGVRYQSSTWSHVRHPYCAVGRSFDATLSTNHIRTAEGVAGLVRLLHSALRLSSTYVGVSGGFRPPLHCAGNRLHHLGRPAVRQERGSEASCVWEHRVLTAEGALADAIVPGWLYKERWLQAYEGAEVRHGLY